MFHLPYIFPFRYTVIIDQKELTLNNFKGIYNTMDKLTWFFVALSLISTICVLILIQRSGGTSAGDFIFQMFGTLLFQGVTFRIQSKKATLILSVWMLALIVISNGYSSILAVLMVKPALPENYPVDLQSLAESSYLKFTFGSSNTPENTMVSLFNMTARELISDRSGISKSNEIRHLEKLVSNTELVRNYHHIYLFLGEADLIFIESTYDSSFEIFVGLSKGFGKKLVPVEKHAL